MEFRDLKTQYAKLKSEIDSGIEDVLSSARYISGSKVKELEDRLAKYVGAKHCVTCGNGTDAITLALMAINAGKGDAVFVPDFTFFSSGECPAFVGATPVFVDVEEETYNIDPNKLEIAIEELSESGGLIPKAVIAVDLFGLPADYERIRAVCNRYNIRIIEDGAQGFGGKIKDARACSFGDISTTSFFPAKPLGCYGDGGAIFTDNDDYAAYVRSICVHGKSGEDKYDNIRVGMNSRLDSLQAAILLPKLSAFDEYELDCVNQVALWYDELLADSEIIIPRIPEGFLSSWAQYTVRLPESIDRTSVQEKLKQKGIPTMIYYMKPMHLQGAFAGSFSSESHCPVTEKLCRTVLSLPMHPYLSYNDVETVVKELRSSIEKQG